MAHTQEGTNGVKHIYEEEGEHAYQHIETQHISPFKLQGDGSDAGRYVEYRTKLGDAQRYSHHGGHQYADKQSACHVLDQQDCTEQNTEAGQQNSRTVQVAQSNKSGNVVHHDTRILQSDEGNKEAYTRRDGPTQNQRHGIHNLLAQTRQSEQYEENTLNEDGCKRKLPCVSHGEHHGIGKECIQTHSGSQRERQLGIDGHHQCGQDGGKHSGREHSPLVHAGITQDRGIDSQNISHGKEGGNTSQYLTLHAHGGSGESE